MTDTPWKLFNEANKKNDKNYSVYRCINPTATITGPPMYGDSIGINICPCDPNLSNPSGRGYTACPFGIAESSRGNALSFNTEYPVNKQIVGTMYAQKQFVPPQFQPNPLVKIGYEWRSIN